MVYKFKLQIIIKHLSRLLDSAANDAVRLMLSDGEKLLPVLDTLNLAAVTELKRSDKGVFEVKLINRLEILRFMAEISDAGPEDADDTASVLLRTLNGLSCGSDVDAD